MENESRMKNTVSDRESLTAKQALIYAGELAETHKKLLTIIDSMSDGMIVSDEHFLVTDANRMAPCFLGVPKEELIGREIKELFGQDLFQDMPARLEKSSDRKRADAEMETPGKLSLKISVSALPGNSGFVSILRDDWIRGKRSECKNGSE